MTEAILESGLAMALKKGPEAGSMCIFARGALQVQGQQPSTNALGMLRNFREAWVGNKAHVPVIESQVVAGHALPETSPFAAKE